MKQINYVLIALTLMSRLTHALEPITAEDFLELGDASLGKDDPASAISYYEKGIAAIRESEDLSISISLHINLGTSYSTIGQERRAMKMYRDAILLHSERIDDVAEEESKLAATQLSAQAAFFLGMTFQELESPEKAADSYSYANMLDPNHWASLGNLGAVLHDELRKPAEALVAYNKAFEILTKIDAEPTDPPEDLKTVLSDLQYRIGLSITYDPKRKCAMQDNPEKEVPCAEVAANAFSLALQFNPENDNAQHMLATVTADATMERASNKYVKQLFEDYAENFEHSLVDELGYSGFERLRRGFDRSFGGQDKVPQFHLVIDAGCGTGLVGEQFRNVSQYLVGADLSPSIIEEAKKLRPNLYDDTRVGDVTDVFVEMKPVSLIIAADSYIYFGDLHPLFSSMSKGLEDGGFVAFTLENVSHETEASLNQNKPNWKWQLTASGRFAHRKEYVQEVGEKYDLKTFYYEKMDGFRFEGGVPVRGHIFILQKWTSHNDL